MEPVIRFSRNKVMLFVIATLFTMVHIYGQDGLQTQVARQVNEIQTEDHYIKGVLRDELDGSPVSFATVAIYNTSDSLLLTGTISNDEGEFLVSPLPGGKYFLAISFVGYMPVKKTIDLTNSDNYDAGTILLSEESFGIDELVVTAQRMRAKSDAGKTTFFTNKRIHDASNTGADVLKYIPGIHVDFLNNVLLEGSSDIIIMVDGMERDANYLRQLSARQIDRVEVMTSPGPGMDANVTGVLNIILNARQPGINGHVYTELPVNDSEVYIFPAYSLNYGRGKINLFTSYNGDVRRLDIVESSRRTIIGESGITEISSVTDVNQRTWSHRFHYGADYLMNERNQLNFYGFINPYSNEHGGDLSMIVRNGETGNEYFSARKDDDDMSFIAFWSLFYKHLFKRPGSELAFDLSYYNQNSETTTSYFYDNHPENGTNDRINILKPFQSTASLKVDFTSQITGSMKLDMGLKGNLQFSEDRHPDDFQHHNNVSAAYGAVSLFRNGININGGMRVEHSTTGLAGSFENNDLALLPYAAAGYQLNRNQSVRLSYRRSIYRPGVYQLNPYVIYDDPFTLRRGNSGLEPVLNESVFLEYSIRPGSGFVSVRLFYDNASQKISELTFVNNSGLLETRIDNLGDVRQYGFQFTGALNLNNSISLNPYFRLFEVSSSANDNALRHGIHGMREFAFATGISAIASFRKDFTATLIFSYDSPQHDIQNITFSDALYFISLEREINQNFRIGIISGIPFAKSFTYHGNKIEGTGFSSHSEGNVKMSAVPVWFKLRYQFSSGRQVNTINRSREQVERRPVRGF